MLNVREKQNGFGVMPLMLVIVVAGLLIGGGVLTYRYHHNKQHKLSSISDSSGSPVTKAPAVSQTQTATTVSQNVVSVPELGIQLTVPDSIKDLTYNVSTVTLKDGQTGTLAMFSTSSLASLDSGCSAANGPLGSLERADGQYPSDDQYAALDYGQLVKQFSGFYIASGNPQGECSATPTAEATASTDRTAFDSAVSTVAQPN